ncbi:CBO0543 family protein [Metabacillus halosaccharovorans]|uniref:CBO0543 family protein n=1 Tax=Metabacillus halosaccharovorans TaxID=930124 RepID=UPI00255A2862|nr:CBO0543 family protein [Metabacillus halosaccharovorans]
MILDLLPFQYIHSISLEQLLKEEKLFYQTLHSYWQEHNYLTMKWWVLVTLSILSPFVWFIFVDKKRITEITAFGMFFGIIAIFLDSIGSNAMVWTYPVRLTPYLYPQMYPYDVGIIIIPFMMVYQRTGKKFIKFFFSTGLLALLIAFVAETTMERFDMYMEITWNNIYSFPIYWIIGLICWSILKLFKRTERKHTKL